MTKEKGGPSGFVLEEADEGGGEQVLPEMTFSTLVLSLATSAMVHLGASPGPEAGDPPEVNIGLARQTIDILEVLSEKTKGNLEAEEEALLESTLHQVHMRFVLAKETQS